MVISLECLEKKLCEGTRFGLGKYNLGTVVGSKFDATQISRYIL
jgi:hypothetical protein